MDASRFDALARALSLAGPRRTVLRVAGGGIGALLAWSGRDALAACKKVGAKCGKGARCCPGARCRHGRCRCRKGWAACAQDGRCRNLTTDAEHCAGCDQACFTGCCAAGECRNPCGDACCADCFAEADTPAGPPHDGTEACCAKSSICTSGTSDPADDLCCWPDEVCLDGHCCCDGCLGQKVCGGKCCPTAACCNGKCCGGGQVCARPKPNKPRTCVSANRTCATDGDCFADEQCWGGVCCAGDRLCHKLGPSTAPVCCAVGMYCDPEISQCCAIGKNCSTSKKVRIHV